MKQHFDIFAGYNEWANSRLYEAASALSANEYRRDCGAFFKSMHGTLNHLLTTDRIWMQRFTGSGTAPDRLDAILFDAFGDLRAARRQEDERIRTYVTALTPTDLEGAISYRRVSSPDRFEQKLWPALAHLFNHQTHHRGQAHAILTQLTGAAPELDLLFFQRLNGLV